MPAGETRARRSSSLDNPTTVRSRLDGCEARSPELRRLSSTPSAFLTSFGRARRAPSHSPQGIDGDDAPEPPRTLVLPQFRGEFACVERLLPRSDAAPADDERQRSLCSIRVQKLDVDVLQL